MPGATGFDSFTYFVGDGIVADSARVTIEIKPNSQPVLVDDTFTVSINSTNNLLDVLANDSDPDGDTLTITSLTEAAHGQVFLEVNNRLRYTPDLRFSGVDTFYYTVDDGWTGVSTASVTVNVVMPHSVYLPLILTP